MSTNVSIIVTRRLDGCPWAEWYLGQGTTYDALKSYGPDGVMLLARYPVKTDDGTLVLELTWEHAREMLIDLEAEGAFYAGHHAGEAYDFIGVHRNKFKYWLVVE